MRTRAIVFPAPGTVTIEDLDLPEPRSADVVVEMQASGISVGTERWAYLGKRREMSFPHVPGYMGIGTVIDTGPDAAARGWRPGMGINFLSSRLPAPYDANSWMGAHVAHAVVDVCTGVDEKPGEHNFFRVAEVPEGLDPLTASLTQLGGVALRGIEMATIKAGTTVLVVGAGVIGQFAAQICRLKGAQVMVTDIQADRLAIAARCGAEWTVNSSTEDLLKTAAATVPGGFAVIIDTSSIPAVVNRVMPLLRTWGTFVFQGWYPPPSGLDLDAIQGRMATCIFPSGHTGTHVSAAMRLVRDGRIDCRSLLTRALRPDEAPTFYRHMAESSDAFLGAAIDWRKP